jgi:hypothetical protein
MKKISYLLAIMVFASALVFGLNTKVSAISYVIDSKEVGNIFSWDYSQLIEAYPELEDYLTEESWNNYQEPNLEGPEDGSAGDPFPDLSSSPVAIIKSGTLIGIFTGDDVPQNWNELPDGMHSISSIAAVPEPGSIISLGLILLLIVSVSRKRFYKS